MNILTSEDDIGIPDIVFNDDILTFMNELDHTVDGEK